MSTARQEELYGGEIQWEAAFFGLLDALGLALALAATAAGAGIAVGVTEFREPAADQLEELSFGGGVLIVLIVGLAYAAGGYVAARMARFDGWRQGVGAWALSALMAAGVAVAAWIGSGELNPFGSLSLPDLPVDEGPLGDPVLVLALLAVVGLIASIAGGRLGERFHRAVDEAGTEIAPPPEREDETETEPEPALAGKD